METADSQRNPIAGEPTGRDDDAFLQNARSQKNISPNYFPYFIADLTFIGLAVAIFAFSDKPLGAFELSISAICIAAGAWCLILPFRKKLDTEIQLHQAQILDQSVMRLQNIESLANKIESATFNWSNIENTAKRSVESAETLSNNMISEANAFKEFLNSAQSEETNHLRLMVEKLKKAEKEWIHVIMGMLDHATALKWAALKSQNPALENQICNFHEQLVEIARQIGLQIFEPQSGDVFDPEIHQPASSEDQLQKDEPIGMPRSAGFRFRGVIVRKALVSKPLGNQDESLKTSDSNPTPSNEDPQSDPEDTQQSLL